MTQKEFTERTGITPTPEQFDYIHAVYMNTSMDKVENLMFLGRAKQCRLTP